MSITEIQKLLQNAGVVGAGGAGFPTYAKLSEAADLLCINAAECMCLWLDHHARSVSGTESHHPKRV